MIILQAICIRFANLMLVAHRYTNRIIAPMDILFRSLECSAVANHRLLCFDRIFSHEICYSTRTIRITGSMHTAEYGAPKKSWLF